MRKGLVIVSDSLQKGYCYTLTAPVGKDFHPDFAPELTPKQMLHLGVFDGAYFEGETKEFPKDWFPKSKTGTIPVPKLNYFKVHASQTRDEWMRKRWIHKDDPRGWFQWYCRYYLGRRHSDDLRQIKRWRAIRRHAGQILKYCERGDMNCRPVQRQALLHWAYDSRRF